MLPEHMESPDPSVGPSSITETGALMCSSGSKTGRVPKDKRIVLDDETKDVSFIQFQIKFGKKLSQNKQSTKYLFYLLTAFSDLTDTLNLEDQLGRD